MSSLKTEFAQMFAFIDEGKVAIFYSPKFREFSIRLRNGHAMQNIQYCPWSGKKLPRSVSKEYFDILEKMNVEPFEHDKIPLEMKSEDWWIKRNL